MSVTITLNGSMLNIAADPETPLLWVLRDELKMTGTKFGCGIAQCGACTVHMDGEPIRSCQTLLEDAEGTNITTIEGNNGKAAEAVQTAWAELNVPQCGYCQSGQILAATALLNETPKPTNEDIDEAMDGNVCRCATYARIRKAIHVAAEKMEA
ncbi:(2Fe-2S)-binding protein [Roseibium algae]|uniref:(2Fe-2S)-binding protein n=1 Tax=Roseibium algae TaxID=3123038 RepID=A0ABU8TNR0_9HYPH